VNGTQDFVPNVFELTGEKERLWLINEHSWLSGILQHSPRMWRSPKATGVARGFRCYHCEAKIDPRGHYIEVKTLDWQQKPGQNRQPSTVLSRTQTA
jgi:hypothetical protein